jgi:high-affinity Fe2+/Pb2+ permease
MRPRAAGILGMVLGLLVSITAGWMIAQPPLSIVGAVVLALGTIIFAVAATWLLRRSWANQAEMPVLDESNPQQIRRFIIIDCILSPLLIGFGVFEIVSGSPAGWIWIGLGLLGIGQIAASVHALSVQGAEEA